MTSVIDSVPMLTLKDVVLSRQNSFLSGALSFRPDRSCLAAIFEGNRWK